MFCFHTLGALDKGVTDVLLGTWNLEKINFLLHVFCHLFAELVNLKSHINAKYKKAS